MQLEPQPYEIITKKNVLLFRVLLLNPAKQEKNIGHQTRLRKSDVLPFWRSEQSMTIFKNKASLK